MKQNETENEQKLEPVPMLVHESDMARAERKNCRLWITINLLIAAIAAYGAIKCLNKHS